MTTEIKVPVLPESVADATVATWHVKVGDKVSRDQVLVDIETDKVVLEVPALADGIITEILHAEGATVLGAQVIGVLSEGVSAAAAPAVKAAAPKTSAASGKIIDVVVPVLPESVADATVATWHVAEGETVKVDQHLVDIETDKVVLEVVAQADGVIGKIIHAQGSTVLGAQKIGELVEGASASAFRASRSERLALAVRPEAAGSRSKRFSNRPSGALQRWLERSGRQDRGRHVC